MTLTLVGEPTKDNMTFRDEATDLEFGLAGAQLTAVGVKGTVTAMRKGTRVGRDYLLLANRDKRRRMAKEVATVTDLDDAQVENLLLDLDDAAAQCLTSLASIERGLEAPLTEEEERQALALLEDPALWARIDNTIGSLGVAGEHEARKLLYLVLTSRLLSEIMSTAIKGPSAAGKSYILQIVLRLFPKSAYFEFTSASERALIYTKADFRHRVLIILEAHENEFLEMLVRTLLSEGHIIYETVVEQESVRLEKEGPTGLIVTTTRANLHDENETRVLSVFIRDDPVQTRAVMEASACRFSGGDLQPDPNLGPFIAMQRWLQERGDHEVVVPFAGSLTEMLPDKPVRWRRDVNQILSAIQACALLHQRQRERDRQDRIVATPDDYEIVRPLLEVALAPSLADNLTSARRDAVEAVITLCSGNDQPTTYSAVGRHLRIDRSAASRRLLFPIEDGYVVNEESYQNRPAKLRPGKETMPTPRSLPSVEEVVEGAISYLPPENPLHACTPAGDAVSESDSEPGVQSGVTLACSDPGVTARVQSGVQAESLSEPDGGVQACSQNRGSIQHSPDFDREGAIAYIMSTAETMEFPLDSGHRIGPGKRGYERRLNSMGDDELKELVNALDERLSE